MTRILVIDDDADILALIKNTLQLQNYMVKTFVSANQVDRSKLADYDLILLDIMMPDVDGLSFCRDIRNLVDCPILFLTAKSQEADVVTGLSYGADDYICKPFRPRELLARINTVLRRKNGKSEFLSCKDITVDVQKAVVRKGNTELFLSALEYRLLLVFLQNPGVVFSRKKLLEMIWDVTGDFISDNTLTVYMKRLRDKIETNPQEPEILLTVRGLGYKAGE